MMHTICATAVADPKRLHSFPGPKFKIQLGEYFHDTNERNLVESYRLVTERDRAMFEGRVLLHKYEEEKKKSETWQDNFIQAEKAIWELLPRSYGRTRYRQINAIAQWWDRVSDMDGNFDCTLAFSRKRKPFANWGRQAFATRWVIWERISSSIRIHYRRIFQTSDSWIAILYQKNGQAGVRAMVTRDMIRRPSDEKWLQTGLILDKSLNDDKDSPS